MNPSEHLAMRHLFHKKALASPSFDIESGWFDQPAHDAARAFFAPVHYEPNYAYPLLVWLHGPGNDERQLVRVMPLVSMRNYVAVAPRGFRIPSSDGASDGLGWPHDIEHVQAGEQRVWESIEAARRKFHVAAGRVFLAGFDCGGTMAFRIALNHPDRFAGVISLGGPFPSGGTPFGQWAQARRLAVLFGACCNSREYPTTQACDDLRLLHAAGIVSITLRHYACEHALVQPMLRDLNRWIMDQVTGVGDDCLQADSRSELTQ
jgi:phospholipase/carboxylesterase